MLKKYLEDLERRLDTAVEEDLERQWREFSRGNFQGDIFSPRRPAGNQPGVEWPGILINDAIDNFDKMTLRELASCSLVLKNGGGAMLNVRANYGTGILSSLFGAEIFMMEAKLNTLPTTFPLPGGADAVRRLLDAGPPDLRAGFGAKVLEMGAHFRRVLAPYPKISRHVSVYHPDLQGPMDICELLWGSEIFLELIDKPELVHAFLSLITDTYIRFARAWREIFPVTGDTSTHWGYMLRGQVMLRDDSAMNLSPEMFQEFIAPYDRRVLAELGGGAVHFCGRGDHYVPHLPEIPGLHAINMSQPQYNDMETIFRHTVDRGLKILGLRRDVAEAAVRAGRNLHGNVCCM